MPTNLAILIIGQAGLMAEVWQFPVVLAPISLDGKSESVILRPVYSREVPRPSLLTLLSH